MIDVRRSAALVGAARTGLSSAPEDRDRLASRLGALHGLPQKVGQLLASRQVGGPGALALTWEGPPAMSFDAARAALEAELGAPLATLFARLDPVGVGASLGQVHRGALHDGTEVAVKIQYPSMVRALETDLAALGVLLRPAGFRRGFDVAAWRGELGEMLRKELDYRAEAAALRRFEHDVASRGIPVRVPAVIGAGVRRGLLTMGWLEGESIDVAQSWPEAERRQVAEALVAFFLGGLLGWGELHADLHPGNLRVRRGDARPLGVLDFGCTRLLEAPLRMALSRLLTFDPHAPNAAARALERLVDVGFDPTTLSPFAERLPAVLELLSRPLRAEGPFDTRAWKLGEGLGEVLGPHRLAFRLAGPAELAYVLRGFHGLLTLLNTLSVAVDWRPHLPAAPAAPPASGPRTRSSSASPASRLRVRVDQSGRPRAQVSLNPEVVDDLVHLVPEEVLPLLEARGLDVDAIAKEARARGLTPGTLFDLTEGDRRYRVWIE